MLNLHFLPANINPGLFGIIAGLAVVCVVHGPIFVLMLTMLTAARSGSYERRSANSRKVYRPPFAVAYGIIGALLYSTYAVAIWPHSMLAPVFQRWAMPGHPGLWRDLLLAVCAIGLAFGGAALWLRCYALTLNLQERTYRSVDSGGLSLKTRSGSWQDIAGVHVYSNNDRTAGASFVYFVGLKLHNNRKIYSVLGGFRHREQAKAFAAKAAQELSLPLISDTWQQARKGQRRRGF